MIVRARTVVTMNGAPIENGAVAVSGNQIADVGKFSEIRARNAGEIVDLGEQALLPGLINAHCHLDYTCLRGKIPPLRPAADGCNHGPVGRPNLRAPGNESTGHTPVATESFADWIRAINAEKAELLPKDYLASINEGFAEASRFGTTTIANLTGFPDLITQITPPIRTWWFAELIDVRAPDRTCEIVDRAVELLESAANWGLAPHALFTASKNLYRRCEQIAQRENILLTTHVAESGEEMQMFRNESGSLHEFLQSIGRPMDDCGKNTPLELLFDALGDRALPQCIVAHLNELTEGDFDLLQGSERRFHVVHSPRSHDYFRHSRFPFEKLRALGFNICLGTDSLASNDSLSLFDEMRAFRRSEPGISPDKILEMVTVNPATALHQENALGRIRRGFHADLVAVRCNERDSPFEQILEFDGSVDWIMFNGEL